MRKLVLILVTSVFSNNLHSTPFAYRCELKKGISFQETPCREPDNSTQQQVDESKINACIKSVKHDYQETVHHAGVNSIRLEDYHNKIDACHNI